MRTVNAPTQVITMHGRLDVAAAPDVRLVLQHAVDNGSGDLVLDLARLEQLDASGLGVLVGAHRRATRAGRTLILRDVPPHVMRLLWVTRLQRVLRLELSAPAAAAVITLPQESLAAS